MKNMTERLNGKTLTALVAAALVASVGDVGASTITVETGYSTAGSQASANDYRSVVEAAVAVATAGYGATHPAAFNNISNHGLFSGPSENIAFEFTIGFGVTAAQAGEWEFRAGTDFGRGGAVFLDGVALGFKTNDMWWAGSYANPTQHFDYKSMLVGGNHVLSIYGLEGCCDGGHDVLALRPVADRVRGNHHRLGAAGPRARRSGGIEGTGLARVLDHRPQPRLQPRCAARVTG